MIHKPNIDEKQTNNPTIVNQAITCISKTNSDACALGFPVILQADHKQCSATNAHPNVKEQPSTETHTTKQL